MIDEIYNRKILEYAANIPNHERLPQPQATAIAHSRLCGSRVTVDLDLNGDVVRAIGLEVKACALGQASSSILSGQIVGANRQELLELRASLYAMLKEEGTPPAGRWHDFEVLLPVRAFKARHASTLLVFDAVADALAQIPESAEGAQPVTHPA